MKWHKFKDRFPDIERPFIFTNIDRKGDGGYKLCLKRLTHKEGEAHNFLMSYWGYVFFTESELNNSYWAYVENWSEPKDQLDEVNDLLKYFSHYSDLHPDKILSKAILHLSDEIKELKKGNK